MLALLNNNGVVPYQYSTSNRNSYRSKCNTLALFLISILHQTATSRDGACSERGLFLISILHQTATHNFIIAPQAELFLISILHQTATMVLLMLHVICCSLSVFYIKPQRAPCSCVLPVVVPYQYSTSNRNCGYLRTTQAELFLISILHQTATSSMSSNDCPGCSLSVFYIKPQRG